ncbi:homoserine/homoserine lactone efflux protein [Pseudoalteromonas aurantia]|uniref:Homoserine/homoserine lactone efflux protein n=1 Tax=Pseudoalteromonas aurantia 208 TaxID=1314867 RepID=A0ABR9EAH6_9GAMM|nr:homoserine/homoserine lactone efflux protein [Pseudoalteromonas aurantia]MBE0367960.1 homoserine/homoserine lactone efflux protein [Pseudoalteromonas aurantia 208]
MDIGIWLTFVAACVVFSLAPGAGTITSINNSMTGGIIAAIKGLVGLQLALALHIMVVSFGLGALLASSVTFFEVFKYIGAAYLIFLGIKKWREKGAMNTELAQVSTVYGQLIKQGFIVNLFNPKSIVFLAAFLPQFVNVNHSFSEQYMILGVTVIVIDSVVMLGYSLLGLCVKPYLSNQRVMSFLNKLFGTLFISMGVVLAKSES